MVYVDQYLTEWPANSSTTKNLPHFIMTYIVYIREFFSKVFNTHAVASVRTPAYLLRYSMARFYDVHISRW